MTSKVRSALRRTFRVSMKDRADGAIPLEYAAILVLTVVIILATVSPLGVKAAQIFTMTAEVIR